LRSNPQASLICWLAEWSVALLGWGAVSPTGPFGLLMLSCYLLIELVQPAQDRWMF